MALEMLTLPEDGQWWHCRVDAEHLTDGPTEFASNLSTGLTMEIVSIQGATHVDNVYLGGRTVEETPNSYSMPIVGNFTIPNVGAVGATTACTQGTF